MNNQVPRFNVLLLEPDPRFRKLVVSFLVEAGFTPIVAANPDEATSLFDEVAQQIDVFITNVVMSEIDGRTLSRQFVASVKT